MGTESMLGGSLSGRTATTNQRRLDANLLRRLFVQLERPFAELLSPAMRTRVVVRLVRSEPLTYGRLLLDATPPTCFAVLRSARWEGRGILELEVPLLRSVVERWLGGPGDTIYTASPGPTEIELRLASRLIQLLLGAWHSAWPAVGPVDWSIEQLTTQPAKIHAWSDHVEFVLASYEVVVGNVMGWLRIAIPTEVLTVALRQAAQMRASRQRPLPPGVPKGSSLKATRPGHSAAAADDLANELEPNAEQMSGESSGPEPPAGIGASVESSDFDAGLVGTDDGELLTMFDDVDPLDGASLDASILPMSLRMAAGELVISSAPIEISLEDWQSLEEGDILTTDHARHQPWEAIFAGEAKTLVRLGKVAGQLAVQPIGHP